MFFILWVTFDWFLYHTSFRKVSLLSNTYRLLKVILGGPCRGPWLSRWIFIKEKSTFCRRRCLPATWWRKKIKTPVDGNLSQFFFAAQNVCENKNWTGLFPRQIEIVSWLEACMSFFFLGPPGLSLHCWVMSATSFEEGGKKKGDPAAAEVIYIMPT